LKILVTGCGSIGKRHIKNLINIREVEVAAHDIFDETMELVSESFGIKVYKDYNDALSESPDAVIVATPTNEHIEPALKAAKAGCHLFIEKPVAHTLEGLDEILSVVKERDLITFIGCNMRFHPEIKKVKELLDEGEIGRLLSANIECGSYMPDWRPSVDYRQVYSAKKELGGGIILDSIHEIDYACWMMGKVDMVGCIADKISSLDINSEDVADIMVRFSSGVIGHIHLDYVQRAYSRKCKIIGENGVIYGDISGNRVGLYTSAAKKWVWFQCTVKFDNNQMYFDEMKHFINCIKGINKPTHDIFDGVDDLKIALAAKKSAKENKFISLV
jgi:predicted dehydrogenase